MTKILLENTNLNRMYEIIRELKQMGLQNQIDFEFSYTPPWNKSYKKSASFSFKNESLASWFYLKYSHEI